MIRLQLHIDLNYTVQATGAEFFFYIHATPTAHQQIVQEHLDINGAASWRLETRSHLPDQRCMRLSAQPGPLHIQYTATLDLNHHRAQPATIAEMPVEQMPLEVLHYILPSRYCQADRLAHFALQEFGHLPLGYTRAQAICTWVQEHVTFRSNSSDVSTSAVDTLLERVGVCRDFAHLMIALCRACNMPARMVTGTDYGADAALGPPDFHAYVEVYLGGRWYVFDPSGTAIPMGMVRLATGRDAADVAFATIFGAVLSDPPRIHVEALHDSARGWEMPVHTDWGLSTA